MTVFSKIIAGEIPSEKVYEDNQIIVIKDIYPRAKTHLLIIPKKEIPTINDITESDRDIIANMFFVAKKVASDIGVQDGYQLKFHVGEKGGQEIMHIHLHLLSDL